MFLQMGDPQVNIGFKTKCSNDLGDLGVPPCWETSNFIYNPPRELLFFEIFWNLRFIIHHIPSQCTKFPRMLKNWLSHRLSLKTRLARCTNGAPKYFSGSPWRNCNSTVQYISRTVAAAHIIQLDRLDIRAPMGMRRQKTSIVRYSQYRIHSEGATDNELNWFDGRDLNSRGLAKEIETTYAYHLAVWEWCISSYEDITFAHMAETIEAQCACPPLIASR